MGYKDQTKFSVSFKSNEKEEELRQWLINKSEIIGPSNFIKQVLYERMLQDKGKK